MRIVFYVSGHGFGHASRDIEVMRAMLAEYATAALALRLPLHGGFEPMQPVTVDVPLVARRSRRDPADTRRALGLPAGRPIVFPSFSSYGADLPMDRIARSDRFTLL